MRINTPWGSLCVKLLVLLLFTALFNSARAQTVWENPKSEVYNFLNRQAQKGNIELADFIQPLSRKEIASKLGALQDSISRLSWAEQQELAFYQKEYTEFSFLAADTTTFLKRDPDKRWRFLSVNKGSFTLRGDPVLSLNTWQGKGRHVLQKGNGLQFWGMAGRHFGFQFFFQDITEKGSGVDSLREFTPAPGIVRIGDLKSKSVNYSDFRGSITYSWKNGDISVGKDQLLWGYGQNGRIVLSDKAPSYPLIRFRYRPLQWLSLDYSHLWLQSSVLDSNATYKTGNTVYGGDREQFIPKFMATHSLNFFPGRGLSFSLGESIVYSDHLDIGYLIPIMFFKAYDQYASRYSINAGSNGQFFFQLSSRNFIPRTHVYSTLFIDEIRTSTIFDKKNSRNQLGFNVGASVTDVLLPYLTLGFEYTRINPFVYQNMMPAQNYSNQGYSLGDWMGNNADRILGYLRYTPLPRLKLGLQAEGVRKGGAGTPEAQYFEQPQPAFLFNLQRRVARVEASASYEWLNNLYVRGSFNWSRDKDVISGYTDNYKGLQLGVSYGL